MGNYLSFYNNNDVNDVYTLQDEEVEKKNIEKYNNKNMWYWGIQNILIERELGQKILSPDEEILCCNNINNDLQNADDLNVKIKPSTRKGKKIEVETDKGIKHIGAKGYNDFAIYKEKNKQEANEKRENYRARHKCDNAIRYSAKHLACEILWGNRKKGILRGK